MATSPSAERLRRALREGDSPLSAAAVRFAALSTVALLGPGAASAVAEVFRERLRAALSGEAVSFRPLALDVTGLVLPLVAAAAAVAAVASLAQTGGIVAFRKPRQGAESEGALPLYRAVRGALVVASLFVATLWCLAKIAPDLAQGSGQTGSMLLVARGALRGFAFTTLSVLGVAAAVDVAVQRTLWKQRWALSPRDAKRDQKDREGDPQIKEARRRAHQDLLS